MGRFVRGALYIRAIFFDPQRPPGVGATQDTREVGPSPHTEAGRLGGTSGEVPAAGGPMEGAELGSYGIVTFMAFLLLFVCV